MAWWLYIAIKQLFPTGKFVSFFAIVSILGVALGILGLFGTQSVMNGFHSKLGEKMRDTSGDIIIRKGGRAFTDYEGVLQSLSKRGDVESVEASARGPVMMLYRNTPIFPILRSYDTLRGKCVWPIVQKNFIDKKTLEDLDDDSIILGRGLAAGNGIFIGEKVEVYSPTMLDKIKKDEVPMPITLRVAGFYHTDYSLVDKMGALVSLRRMQELYGLENTNGIHEIAVRLKDESTLSNSLSEIEKEIAPSLTASTWLDSNQQFLEVIAMEKTMMSLIIFLIIIVASFSICISLYTSVLRKTKEIGLMSAMGATPLQIIFMYCLQGFFIGLLGSLFGLLLTYVVLENREPIVNLIVGKQNLTDFYFFTQLPVKYSFSDAWKASLFAVVLCTLAGFIPAIWASKLKASEAMRND